MTLREIEREAILDALENASGSQKNAAKTLGINSRTLSYKIHTVHHIPIKLKLITVVIQDEYEELIETKVKDIGQLEFICSVQLFLEQIIKQHGITRPRTSNNRRI